MHLLGAGITIFKRFFIVNLIYNKLFLQPICSKWHGVCCPDSRQLTAKNFATYDTIYQVGWGGWMASPNQLLDKKSWPGSGSTCEIYHNADKLLLTNQNVYRFQTSKGCNIYPTEVT